MLYHFISSHREHKTDGGVELYIESHLELKLKTDPQSPNDALYESLLVEIIQPHGKDIIVACFYWLPGVLVADFNNSLGSTLLTTIFENKLSYPMDDFNINILNSQSH